jgi:hypothetical protein
LWLILPLCLTSLAAAVAETVPFVAQYRLTRDAIPVGETRVSLELRAGGGYLYRARTTPSALVSLLRADRILEQSEGRLLDGRPRPDRYTYRREGSGADRHMELSFDWTRMRVRVHDERSSWMLDVPEGALDKLVQQLMLSLDLGAGARNASYRVADGGLLKDYDYRVLGSESVTTPFGRFDTLRVKRSKDRGPVDYTLWVAPQLDHLPVRILRRHKGKLFQMDLTSLEADGH